jgi:hypothetical protein
MDALASRQSLESERLIARLDRCVFVIFFIRQRSLDPEFKGCGSCLGRGVNTAGQNTHHSIHIASTLHCLQ